MDRGIFVALSGAMAQERRLEAITDNLANVSTSGFKKQKPVFENAIPRFNAPRTFVRTGALLNDMSQGANQLTGRSLDVAMNGEGFLAIQTPAGTRYTRNGSLALDPAGNLVTREGYAVLGENGPIRLSSTAVVIDAEGNIVQDGEITGKLKTVFFDKPEFLRREGNFYSADNTGANEITPKPGANKIEQGYLEVSNVSAVYSMTSMIEALRSYETHTKMIQTLDDMTKRAIDEVGRT